MSEFPGGTRKVSMSNSNEYMNDYMKRRYRQRRELAIQTLGGECVVCGSNDDLEIDHIEREGVPHNKKFSKFWNMALFQFMKELEKCQLLCSYHHLEKTKDDLGVIHGGGVSGKKNCRCELCGPLKNAYLKRYQQTN